MKILLAGPIDTEALGRSTGLNLSALPPGTAQTPIAPLAGGLLRAGHHVHVVTLDPSLSATEEFQIGDLKLSYCPLRGAPSYRARERGRDFFAKEIAHLTSAMRRSDADIVHAHWTYEFAEAALRCGRPSLVTMHDLGWSVLFSARDLYRAVRLAMKLRVMIRARHVSAVSPHVARRAWHYGHLARAEIVPNPIEFARDTAKTLQRPVIVTVGDATRLKNVAASLAAFREVRLAFSNAELHLFGPGLGEDEDLFSPIPGVSWHGKVSHAELMRFLENEANLLVHPSRSESFGVILGEAKMRGVPVIAGRRSGGAAYVVSDAGGSLVDIERPSEIAQAALALLTDPPSYRIAQAEAHRDAAERFSVEQVSDQYLRIYRNIISKSEKRSADQ